MKKLLKTILKFHTLYQLILVENEPSSYTFDYLDKIIIELHKYNNLGKFGGRNI